jgi:hypothetical protein
VGSLLNLVWDNLNFIIIERHYLLWGLFFLVTIRPLVSQTGSPKSTPPVFFHETFNWKNVADPKGWSMPANVYLEDPNNTGFNWHWWPNDSLLAISMKEPPLQSSSKEDGYLCLFGAHYQDYAQYYNNLPIDNSIVFKDIDCSQHASVILEFQTNFRNKGYPGLNYGWQCQVQVSPDSGYHWTEYDAGFNTGWDERPNDVGPGQPALYRVNLTEVAAGVPNLMIRIRWANSYGWYFWIIDDLKLCEALPNDLHINYFDLQWDDKITGIDQSASFMMPWSQVGKGMGFEQFKSGITNMGAAEAKNIVFDVSVKHEDEVVYYEAKTLPSLKPGYKDSLALSGRFEPIETGRYSLQYRWQQWNINDDYPTDNIRVVDFIVSDSVYNRAGIKPDYLYSYNFYHSLGDDWATPANINHFQGESFPIYSDCVLEGISAYVTGGLADGLIDFCYSVWLADYYEITTGRIDPRFLMRTERVYLDSSMFNTWVYLPLSKNGEDEYIKAGSLLWAGVEYTNWHSQESVRRDYGMSLGGCNQTPQHHYRTVFGFPFLSPNGSGKAWIINTTKNLMIQLHLKKSPITSGFDMDPTTFELSQNYPNPFSYQTVINYQIGTDSPVRLEISDLTGRKVLVKQEGYKPPGSHQILIKDTGLVPGVYFYTLVAGDHRETKRMIVGI